MPNLIPIPNSIPIPIPIIHFGFVGQSVCKKIELSLEEKEQN